MDTQRWHIGQNMPGYMPNEDPFCIEGSEADARNAAREEAERALDCYGDCGISDDAHTEAASLDDSGDYWFDDSDCGCISTGGLHIWYAACESPEECAAEESSYVGHPGEFSRERFGAD